MDPFNFILNFIDGFILSSGKTKLTTEEIKEVVEKAEEEYQEKNNQFISKLEHLAYMGLAIE